MSKKPLNPLLGASNFNLEESFGIQPTLIVPPSTAPALSATSAQSPMFTTPAASESSDPFSDVNLGSSPIKPPNPIAPPPVMSLGPPQPGLFLLPSTGATPSTPAPTTMTSLSGSKPRSRYVPPPGIHASASSGNLSSMSPMMPPPSMTPMPGVSTMIPAPVPNEPSSAFMPSSSSVPDFGAMPSNVHQAGPELYPGQYSTAPVEPPIPKVDVPDEPLYHWYFKVSEMERNVLNPTANINKITESWRPFSMRDSMALEHLYGVDKNTNVLIPTDGGRYDVNIPKRIKIPVYWKDELNQEMEVRRASWFNKNGVNTWEPYDEALASRLEAEFQDSLKSGRWKREIRLTDSSEAIRMISPNMMYHLPSEGSLGSGKLDEWGQVQPSQDPSMAPREVHRGIEGIIDDIPDGEDMACDHLVFVIHGIGAACDIKFRPIHEVVDSYRDLTHRMSRKHFQKATLMEEVNRVEFLPVNWHKTLHGEDTGTDERLKPLTLKSIPKLRNFVNDTLLDILFYTSPIYCQTILNTVVSEINRLYTLFCERNEDFSGKVSIMGHSLGSLITFDLLSHQTESAENEPLKPVSKPVMEKELSSIDQVFEKLEITEHLEPFTSAGIIDMDSLMLCTEDDLKEANMPLGPRKKLLHYLQVRKAIQEKKLSGLEEYEETSITSDVKYRIGPAGTGQPSVKYPKLDFEPASFYALGSPIGLFHAVRGISNLGPNFKFPTCPKFFNIFHPYDPVAYRIESLIEAEYANLRPVTIPHHAGRKRMHLELKDTVTKLMTGDIKKKLMDSVWSTLSGLYNTATGNYEAEVKEAVEAKLVEDDLEDANNPSQLDSLLNNGSRIDYVLQEAPYETFNEYVFALGSHLCYWESEDTCLMILKDIYGLLGIKPDDHLEIEAAAAMTKTQNDLLKNFVDDAPTAILRPPPIPMGAPMPTPTPTASTLVPPGSVPIATPTVTASSNFPASPLVMGPPVASTPLVPPPSGPPTGPPSMSLGPPPSTFPASPLMAPLSGPPSASPTGLFGPPSGPPSAIPPPMGPPPTSLTASSSYSATPLSRPRRAAYPMQASATPMGMDPTAPTSGSPASSLGPPPTTGFMR